MQLLLQKTKDNIFYVLSLSLIIFSVFYFYNYTYKNKKVSEAIKLEAKKEGSLYDVPNISDHYKVYSTSSRVTIINYISLDCQYCRGAYLLEDSLMEKYFGKVNLVYRHNPLDHQPLSPEKALIAECVYDQGGDIAFFKFLTTSFTNFNKENKNNEWLKVIARKNVNSKEEFEKCLENSDIKNKIQEQKNKNVISNITYTPTLLVFIDGEFVKKFDNLGSLQVIKIIDFYLNLKLD
jgi:protein-disulfide isomerase